MSCSRANNKCTTVTRSNGRLSWIPAVLIAILPKCPFCVMAYSGAMSLCSGRMLYPNAGGWSGYVTVGVAALVLISILINRRDGRTHIAALIALLGISLLAYSQFVVMSSIIYYLAVSILFFGIWYNGSFLHFYHTYFKKRLIQRLKSQV